MREHRILIVEDSALQRRMYDLVFRSQQRLRLELVFAQNGYEALAHLSWARHVSLILLDLDMPVINGIEFLERLHREPAMRKAPVVICTTHDHDKDIERALRLGARAYIHKPFKPDDLMTLVTKIVEPGYSLLKSGTVPTSALAPLSATPRVAAGMDERRRGAR